MARTSDLRGAADTDMCMSWSCDRAASGPGPEVYVGDTHESPEERFYKHVIGHRRRGSGVRTSAECVRGRGMRLAYELFHHINPMPPPLDVCERDKELRRQLEVEYDICGSPDCMEPRAKSSASAAASDQMGGRKRT